MTYESCAPVFTALQITYQKQKQKQTVLCTSQTVEETEKDSRIPNWLKCKQEMNECDCEICL